MAQPEVILVILMFVLLGTLPTWPYSRKWTYRPSAVAATLILLLFALFRTRVF